VVNEFKDIHTTINFLQEIEEYNKNIIIVINKVRGDDFAHAKKI
jgi:hypothetical protein